MVPTDSPLVIFQSQSEFRPTPKGLATMPSALKSPKPALPSPNRAVSFDTKHQQEEGIEAPEGSSATPSSLKKPRLSPLSTRASRRSVSFRIKEIKPDEEEEQAPEGQLRFQLDNGDVFEDGDALRAFTSIAQVGVCAKKPDSFARQQSMYCNTCSS